MSLFSFDHAVLVVADLEGATRQFQGMGFTVIPGGVHVGRLTHNALIAFEDGAYLELLAPYSRGQYASLRLLDRIGLVDKHPAARTPLGRRFAESLLMGEGVNDFALGAGHLEEVILQAHARNLPLASPASGGRELPDGRRISWRTACPESRDLPFLIQDITPREARVPSGQAVNHPNQVRGVAALTVVVADLAASASRYTALLGSQPAVEGGTSHPAPEARASHFLINKTSLALEQRAGSRNGAPQVDILRANRLDRIWLRSSESPTRLSVLDCMPGKGYRLSNYSASESVV